MLYVTLLRLLMRYSEHERMLMQHLYRPEYRGEIQNNQTFICCFPLSGGAWGIATQLCWGLVFVCYQVLWPRGEVLPAVWEAALITLQ